MLVTSLRSSPSVEAALKAGVPSAAAHAAEAARAENSLK
jgi:hypothetical protein